MLVPSCIGLSFPFIHQGASNVTCIKIGYCTLGLVDDFTYHVSIISGKRSIDIELSKRIGKASASMSRLAKIWKIKLVKEKTKTRVYQACFLSTLLYCSETLTILMRHERRLNTFHVRCLKRI